MASLRRVILSAVILSFGLAAQARLETMMITDRPPLRQSLSSLPMVVGDWVGRDEEIDPRIKEESQATEFINRVYVRRDQPERRLTLWINYSYKGDNLRHSPEICLPSKGYNKLESECRVISVRDPGGNELPVSRLGYDNGDLFQCVGFWYYIFGEGQLEKYVRHLPITSRSSHGRTTRGSSLTVEVFSGGETLIDDNDLKDFAGSLLQALEPIMPADRAEYFVP